MRDVLGSGGRCLLLLADRGFTLGNRLLARLVTGLGLGLAGVDRGLAAGDLRLLGGEAGGLLLELRLAAVELLGRLLELAHARLDLGLALGGERVLGDDAVLELGEPLLLGAHHGQLLGDAALALLELGFSGRQAGGALVELRGAATRVDLEVRHGVASRRLEVDHRGLQIPLAGQRRGELATKRFDIGIRNAVRLGKRGREALVPGGSGRLSLRLAFGRTPELGPQAGSETGLGVAVLVLGHVFRSCHRLRRRFL